MAPERRTGTLLNHITLQQNRVVIFRG